MPKMGRSLLNNTKTRKGVRMKTLLKYDGIWWGIRLEFKLQDFWMGVFWKNNPRDIDIWICIIPCFPIHYWSGRDEI